MKTTLNIFLIFICTTLTVAAKNLSRTEAMQASLLDSKNYLNEVFVRDLEKSTGLSQFSINLEFTISDAKLLKTMGISLDDEQTTIGLELPGLFIENKEEYVNHPIRSARREDILFSINSIKAEISYHSQDYDKKVIEESLQRIVNQYLPHLSKDKIIINSKITNSPHLKPKKEYSEILADTLKNPIKIDFNDSINDIWTNYYKIILAVLALSLLFGTLVIGKHLKSGFEFIVKAINTSRVASSEGTSGRNISLPNQEFSTTSPGPESFDSYIQAIEHLKAFITKSPAIFDEIVTLKVIVEDYLSLTILLDALDPFQKDRFFKSIDPKAKSRFQSFIVNEGTGVFKNDQLAKQEAIKVIKLLKVASLYPVELYKIVATDSLRSFTSYELGKLIQGMSDKEISFIIDAIDPDQIALLLQSELLSPNALKLESHELSNDELLNLIFRMSKSKNEKVVRLKRDKLEYVYALIENNKAETLASAFDLESELRFDHLFNTHKVEALKYLEKLEFVHLSSLFPLLSDDIQTNILNSLPDLLAERLKYSKKSTNSESLKIKGEFYFYLRSIHQQSQMANPTRIAA